MSSLRLQPPHFTPTSFTVTHTLHPRRWYIKHSSWGAATCDVDTHVPLMQFLHPRVQARLLPLTQSLHHDSKSTSPQPLSARPTTSPRPAPSSRTAPHGAAPVLAENISVHVRVRPLGAMQTPASRSATSARRRPAACGCGTDRSRSAQSPTPSRPRPQQLRPQATFRSCFSTPRASRAPARATRTTTASSPLPPSSPVHSCITSLRPCARATSRSSPSPWSSPARSSPDTKHQARRARPHLLPLPLPLSRIPLAVSNLNS